MHVLTSTRGPGRAWGWLVAVALLAFCALVGPLQAQEAAVQWGQRLLATQELPAEALTRFLQVQEKNVALRAGETPASEAWRGEESFVAATGSPYTLVLKVTGVALADGDAGVRMQTGWMFDGSTTQLPMPGMAQKDVRAGQVVELVGVSTPMSLNADRKGAPTVEFTAAANLRLQRVQVDVWTGQRPTQPVERLMSWMPVLLGAIVLGFFWWLRRQ